ncbi:DsbA family oxidoreductase [Propionibacteriaceae bacterium Y2011]|uniref:DsbA family oxidoreductase n=1 Tax=Microlunatus sp. Y2014 TaxID=3418488 RepID=UPI003B48D32F
MDIDIWSDIACPWCYIGKRRFEKALAGFEHAGEVNVTWHSYQLDPSLPEHYDGTEVDYLSSRKGMPAEQVRQMFAHVTEQAAGEGLTYDFDSLQVANSLRAHQLIHLAAAHGVADAVTEALMSGHFERGADIGDVDTLTRIGVEAGLAAADVTTALAEGTYLAAVEADVAAAQEIGVQGVPFFVIGRYGVSGAQPVEVFGKALTMAWDESRPVNLVGVDDADACGPDGCAV